MAFAERSSASEQVSSTVAKTRHSNAAQKYVQTTLRSASAIAVGCGSFVRGTTPLKRMHERVGSWLHSERGAEFAPRCTDACGRQEALRALA